MDVKLGMNMLLWGVDITAQHIPVFEGLQRAGFDGVEIPMVGQSSGDIKAMAAACDDLGLARTTAAFITPEVNPISPDASIRAAAIDNLKHTIDQSCELGSSILIGGLYQAHKVFLGRGPNAD